MLTNFGSFPIQNLPPESKTTFLSILAGLSLLVTAGIATYSNGKKFKKFQNYALNLESQINSLLITQTLRADQNFEDMGAQNLAAGALKGKGRIALNPLVFYSKEKMELVTILHVGEDMCGHSGIVHGGYLSTIMDELLARTVFPSLPEKNGATAYLHVNFRKPCKTDQILIGRAKVTKIERKKGFVKGSLETLDNEILVDGDALFISVKKL
ncbi:5017_t:CDS:2 [Diversispora eburnea]|uniref:5017_t:CDS:1 n=1 Tax=Diversispora eburnea TaxID=1213867 RepID=A0A9N8YPA6_9GLOM|nr:5017_t:CDS:2 [Diversispora eburnea]